MIRKLCKNWYTPISGRYRISFYLGIVVIICKLKIYFYKLKRNLIIYTNIFIKSYNVKVVAVAHCNLFFY